MIPLLALGLAAGGSAAWNWFQQRQSNKDQKSYNQQMYARQRNDSLSDWFMQNQYNEQLWHRQNQYNEGLWNKQNEYNEQLWHKMNQYNSPMAQMARFKEAGLNPNLIYGQSNTGGSISTANLESTRQDSSGIRPSTPGSYSPRPPQFDIQNGILSTMAMREKAAQINNLETMNKVYEQDAILRAAQTASTVANTSRSKFDLDLASELRATSVDAANASLRRMQTETDISLQRNEREVAQNASNLREAAYRIAQMRGQTINAALDGKLKQLDINLKQMGIQPSDNVIMRILGQLFKSPVFPENVSVQDLLMSD